MNIRVKEYFCTDFSICSRADGDYFGDIGVYVNFYRANSSTAFMVVCVDDSFL